MAMVRVKADEVAIFKRKKRLKRSELDKSLAQRLAELEKRVEMLEKLLIERK